MGIKGFPQFLGKHLVDQYIPIDECVIRKHRIAIDIGGFMHRFTENMHYPTEYVARFLEFARSLAAESIAFVFVFDGMVATCKSATLLERRAKRERSLARLDLKCREVLHQEQILLARLQNSLTMGSPESTTIVLEKLHRSRLFRMRLLRKSNPVCRRFFYHLETVFAESKIRYVVSDGEAEKACAWLAQNGHVDLVVSDDYDTLVCGAPHMLCHWRQKKCFQPSVVTLVTVLSKLGLSYDEFVSVCVLAGSDFAKPPPQFAFKRALVSVRAAVANKAENALTSAFDGFYRGAYPTTEAADSALGCFEQAKQHFIRPEFPFARSFLIFALVSVVHAIVRWSITRALFFRDAAAH